MKQYSILLLILVVFSCKTKEDSPDFTIAFGSCNNQQIANPFWEDIHSHKPNVWIWGGDIIYSDTEDMKLLEKNYNIQKNKLPYQEFIKTTDIMGTWDDHDYGVNDGGSAYPMREASQQLLLDFLDVPKNDMRRNQKGVYFSKTYSIDTNKIKILVLDTRYFRSDLTPDDETDKRYKPNPYGSGTMLGETQWKWLEDQLTLSDAQYHILMSSVQVFSNLHGFESWGNMPHEVDRLEKIILESQAKGVIILSGDRHISEISQKNIGPNKYSLIDFTSSGMTHSYTNFSGEENPFRVSEVIYQKSYGTLKFDFNTDTVLMEMWGEKKELLDSYTR